MNTPTIKDLIDFILLNKKDKVFKGCSENRIANEVLVGLVENTLCYATDEQGKLIGMLLAEKDVKHKRLFVTRNLAMSLKTLRLFAQKS